MENNDFYIALLENDLNPFILFNNNGKMKDFNKEAEFLFNFVKPKELYELAVSNASLSFGFNKNFVSLKYGKLSFYAILVGYINDDEIGLRLYKEVCNDVEINMSNDIEPVNIFSLIEISKNTTFLQSDIIIKEEYDISIPEIKININQFLLTLNESFELFKNRDKLDIKVYIKLGEYEIIKSKKYKIISIEFISDKNVIIPEVLNKCAIKANINLFIEQQRLKLEFPVVL
jgi:nitrogen-specific signal transduction histidine kinase